MPRPKTQKGEAHASEQARYRERLKARGAPEASEVDAAVAASVAVSFARSREKPNGDAAFNALIELTQKILVDRGYDGEEADRKTRGRLQFRADLDALDAVTTRTSKSMPSPRYFDIVKRDIREARSDQRDRT